MSTSFRLGKDSVLYQGAAGSTPATPTGKTVSANLKVTKKEADCTVRDTGGWEDIKPAIKAAALSWDMKVKKDDPGLAAIKAAFQNDTPIALMPLDAPVGDDGQGLDADWYIFEYDEKQELDGVVTISFSAKTDCDARQPQWV